jgi:hypothetical protein
MIGRSSGSARSAYQNSASVGAIRRGGAGGAAGFAAADSSAGGCAGGGNGVRTGSAFAPGGHSTAW